VTLWGNALNNLTLLDFRHSPGALIIFLITFRIVLVHVKAHLIWLRLQSMHIYNNLCPSPFKKSYLIQLESENYRKISSISFSFLLKKMKMFWHAFSSATLDFSLDGRFLSLLLYIYRKIRVPYVVATTKVKIKIIS